LFKRWGRALDKIVRAVDTLPAKRPPAQPAAQPAEAVHAREMLERIRHGEYEFSDAEICDILRRNNWLGAHQAWFESVDIPGDNLAEVRVRVPILGRLVVLLTITDLWHDCRVSSIDFQISSITRGIWRGLFYQRVLSKIFIWLLYMLLRWNGSWRHESLRFVLRVNRTIRLYVEWPEKKSPLLGNISVIGARIRKNSVVFYTFRRVAESKRDLNIALPGSVTDSKPSAFSRVAVLFSWLLLGAYAFVLVHVTLPVLSGAFRLMPQDAKGWHIWLLTQTYNLCVMLLSYFFLRITMLPLYLKWNKSREDLATLISLEERDHQYLRPLTELVKKMQQARHASLPRQSRQMTGNVTTETIAQMIELMSNIRDQSRQRLLGMTRMRRGWVQDLLIGYVFIFSLEWMYYQGLLTPLSVSIKWVNRIMVGLFLSD
jgi:hypothetical protein